jgi:Amt family ammonium transporter
LIAVNTTLTAVSGGIASLLITRLRFGRPDASLATNGWVCGLVASSATSLYVKPAEAVLIGLLAGALVIFAIELRMKVDDPGGAISVHAAGGIWGIIAAGIFGSLAGDGSQLLSATRRHRDAAGPCPSSYVLLELDTESVLFAARRAGR